MYILLALIGACVLGIAAHFLIRGRELRGVAFTPAIATTAAAVLYTGLQWGGVGEGDPLLWLVSVLGAVAIAAVITLLTVSARGRSDAAAKTALGI